MTKILLSIFLTAIVPCLSLADRHEFLVENSGDTLFFRLGGEGFIDEVHLKTQNGDWLLLTAGVISEVHTNNLELINLLPDKILKKPVIGEVPHLKINGQYELLILYGQTFPGRGRYILPDSDARDVAHSTGMFHNSQYYRVISYRTPEGPKTVIVNRDTGKSRLIARRYLADPQLDEVKLLENGTVTIGALGLAVDLNTVEKNSTENFHKLVKIQEESEGLRSELKSIIFGQDRAVDAIANSYREMKTNTSNKPRVLLAMGPSGTGKTFTAETFAELKAEGLVMNVKGNEYNAHIGSLDYMKLLGGAEGTSASKPGALLTWVNSLKGRPGVLIIDEGDKMNIEVWLRMMEFLNTGALTGPDGKEVRAHNLTVFITTNRGAKRMFPINSKNWTQQETDERMASLTQEELRSYYEQRDGLNDKNVLPTEILNRIDEFIPYAPLTKDAAIGIAKTIARDLTDHYETEYSIKFNVKTELLKEIALADFNGSVDGRAVKKKLKNIYSDALSLAVSKLNLAADGTVVLGLGVQSSGQKFLNVEVNGKAEPLRPLVTTPPNALDDSQQAARLLIMESELNKEVIGQKEAMHEIAEAAKAHAGGGDKKRPLIIFLGGISGNGKTETGRALAKFRYGSENRLSIISLGGVQDTQQFDTIFGSAAQMQGGDIERVFEKALRENPNGGVLIFDEISNMGGTDIAKKESLMMKFYELFEEGRYVSPIDGREFMLDKYTVVLTGNDGQDEFRNITSDDLLLETWKQNKSPEKIRKLLRERGWPAALVNRIAIKLLLKPLLSHEIGPIAQKLLNREIKTFQEANPRVKINVPAEFSAKLAKAFFSPDQGGRGIRDILETKIRASFVNAVLHARVKQPDLKELTLDLNLTATKRIKPYDVKGTEPRQVKLSVNAVHDGKTLHDETNDLTNYVPQEVMLSTKNAKLVSFHEAGHAVVGERTTFITIRGGHSGDSQYYGYAREDYSKRDFLNLDRKQTIQQIAVLWAGRKAQELAGFTADSGWNQDLEQIRKLMRSHLLISGLDRDFVGVALNNGVPQLSNLLQNKLEKKMAAMEKEGELLAEKILKERWDLVRSVVAELLLKGEIAEPKLNVLKRNWRGSQCRKFYGRD